MDAPAQPSAFPNPEAAAASITAAISTVAVARGWPATAAEVVADLLTRTAKSVALAPADKAQVVAAALVADVTDHALNTAAGNSNGFGALRRRLHEELSHLAIPDARPGFYFVLYGVCYHIKETKLLPQGHVAITITGAVAAVANAVANAPAETRLVIAAACQTTAKHAADAADKAICGTGRGAVALGKFKRDDERRRHTAVLEHETDLWTRAALGALQTYTADVGHVQAARALDAVVAGARLCSAGGHPWQHAPCTYACAGEGEGEGSTPAECEGALRAGGLLTGLYAVWSLYQTTAPESEAAKALAAAVAGAVGGPAAPPLERPSAGEIRAYCNALLQVAREMDEEPAAPELETADLE